MKTYLEIYQNEMQELEKFVKQFLNAEFKNAGMIWVFQTKLLQFQENLQIQSNILRGEKQSLQLQISSLVKNKPDDWKELVVDHKSS